MKRFIKILIIILIIAAIVLGIAWMSSRRTAVKNGAVAPTFRQFLSGETKLTGTPTENPGSLSGSFTEDLEPTTTPTTSGSLTAPGTTSSIFTSGTISPSNNTGSGSSTGSSSTPTNNPGSSGGSTSTPITPGTITTTSGSGTSGTGTPSTTGGSGTTSGGSGVYTSVSNPPVTPGTTGGGSVDTQTSTSLALQCGSADLTIAFTDTELAKIQALQRRFNAVVELLHTNSDVAIEVSNYDTFLLKEQQLLELKNYCESKEVLLTDPALKTRVATPFWRNPSKDTPNLGGYRGGPGPYSGSVNDNNTDFGKRTLEHVLRLNLW